MSDRIAFAGDTGVLPRDVHTRCLCGHLLFIHVDADRCVPVGDEPPYGVIYERRGECLHADCTCREPRVRDADRDADRGAAGRGRAAARMEAA